MSETTEGLTTHSGGVSSGFSCASREESSSPGMAADSDSDDSCSRRKLVESGKGTFFSPFDVLTPIGERTVQDRPFHFLGLATALGVLLLFLRVALVFPADLLRALALVPAVALAAVLGGLACLGLAWLAALASPGRLKVCLQVLSGLAIVGVVLVALGLLGVYAVLQAMTPKAEEIEEPASLAPAPALPILLHEGLPALLPLLKGAFLALFLILALFSLLFVTGYCWICSTRQLLEECSAVVVGTAEFLLKRGRSVILLTAAAFCVAAVLILPALTAAMRTLDTCMECLPSLVQDAMAVAQEGLAPSASAQPPVPSVLHALPFVAAGHFKGAPPSLLLDSLRPVLDSLVRKGVVPGAEAAGPSAFAEASQKCMELGSLWASTFGSSLAFVVVPLALVVLSWAWKVVALALVFMASFFIAEEHSAASRGAPVKRTPVLRALSLCAWESLGTLTLAAAVMMALPFVVIAGGVALLLPGFIVPALAWYLLGLLTTALFDVVVFWLAVPLVALYGCSFREAIFLSWDLLRANSRQALALFVSLHGLDAVLLFLTEECLSLVRPFPALLFGSLYGGYMAPTFELVVRLGSSFLLYLFNAVFMASFFSTFVSRISSARSNEW